MEKTNDALSSSLTLVVDTLLKTSSVISTMSKPIVDAVFPMQDAVLSPVEWTNLLMADPRARSCFVTEVRHCEDKTGSPGHQTIFADLRITFPDGTSYTTTICLDRHPHSGEQGPGRRSCILSAVGISFPVSAVDDVHIPSHVHDIAAVGFHPEEYNTLASLRFNDGQLTATKLSQLLLSASQQFPCYQLLNRNCFFLSQLLLQALADICGGVWIEGGQRGRITSKSSHGQTKKEVAVLRPIFLEAWGHRQRLINELDAAMARSGVSTSRLFNQNNTRSLSLLRQTRSSLFNTATGLHDTATGLHDTAINIHNTVNVLHQAIAQIDHTIQHLEEEVQHNISF